MEVKKRDDVVVKIGNRFKDKATGKIYVVTTTFYENIVILEGKDSCLQMRPFIGSRFNKNIEAA